MSKPAQGVPSVPAASRPALRACAMRIDDLDAVMAIETAVYPFPWSRGNFADSLTSGYDAWVFRTVDGAGDTLPGYAVLMWIPDEVHLLNLSVAAAMQGRGIGREMLHWLMRDARRRGARGMMLEVRPSNLAALALYRSEGFTQIGARKGYYPAPHGAREDAWVMSRKLRDE